MFRDHQQVALLHLFVDRVFPQGGGDLNAPAAASEIDNAVAVRRPGGGENSVLQMEKKGLSKAVVSGLEVRMFRNAVLSAFECQLLGSLDPSWHTSRDRQNKGRPPDLYQDLEQAPRCIEECTVCAPS